VRCLRPRQEVHPMTTPKERPLNLTSWQARAVLDGTKTQHRVPVKPHRARKWKDLDPLALHQFGLCPLGMPGDRLWGREKHVLLDRDGWWDSTLPREAIRFDGNRNGVAYADNEHDADSERCRKEQGYSWRPSIHMPRRFSRITLEIVSVRVERLNEISDGDAVAEGISTVGNHETCYEGKYRTRFAAAWDTIHRKRHPWSSNPWVWAITFKRLEPT
jgi:hypothetical protein